MDLRKGNEIGARGSMRVVKAKAHGALVKGATVVLVCDSGGLLTAVIPNAVVATPAVALEAVASGEVGEFCLEGVCYIYMMTAGGATLGDGILADNSEVGSKSGGAFAGYPGDPACTDFAVALETTTAAGLCKCYMHGYPIVTTA